MWRGGFFMQRCNCIVHHPTQTGQHARCIPRSEIKAVCSVSPKFSGSHGSSRKSELTENPTECAHTHRPRSTGRISEHRRTFTESRRIVCMIDRVCFVMYRCNYELLISPYNLFHPTTNTLQPGRLLRLWAAVTDCSVCG